jgi:lipoprotein-anchoring transpeptidase ErfK/SrfK
MFFLFGFLFSTHFVVIDLPNYKWIAYDGDKEIMSGVASGGRKWCPDIHRRCKSPVGLFQVVSKKGRFYRSPLYPVGCDNSTENKCAPMPWAVKFKHSGEAIHGHRGRLTQHISHGCIHVSYKDAKLINEFLSVGDFVEVKNY